MDRNYNNNDDDYYGGGRRDRDEGGDSYGGSRGGSRGGYRPNYNRGGFRDNRSDRNDRNDRDDRDRDHGDGGYGDSKVKSQFADDDFVSVKIRGLPYQVRYEEVSGFFQDFNIIERSVVLGKGHDGRKNGFGAILFESESEAKAAMQQL